MPEAQKSYGKPLFFSKLHMVPVKEEPVEEQKAGAKRTGNRKREAGNR